MYKILSLVLLLVAIFGSAFANVEAVSTIQLHMYGASSVWWVAVQPRNDNGLASKVEVKDSASSSFTTLIANKDWGYWSVSASGSAFVAPLSFRLTSSSGATITVQVNSIIADQLIDSGATFSGSASTPVTTTKPTTAPPAAAATTRPTSAPVTSAPVTSAPVTSAPVTSAPVTSAPTTKPTTAPVSTNLCAVTSVKSEPLKVMVPLYVYPGAAWDALIAAASKVKIVAIINPNSGPLATVDSAYSTYMTKLKNAGVEMVGYVYTSYGTRDVNAVKADIDTYASKYPLVTGIFLDEAANDASKIPFYTQVYNHIMSKSGYKHAILNPGTQPDQGYLAISTNIMAFENYASAVASTTMNIVKCATTAAQKTNYKYKFSAIAHTASASVQATYVNSLANMGFGYVYVTDGAGGCCTYNTLTTYFAQLAAAVEAYNKN